MPLIDLDIPALRAEGTDRHRDAVAALGRAGRTCGAAAVVEHGLDAALLARTFDAARRFFSLPLEAKGRSAAGPDNLRGYQPLPTGPGDVREKFLVTSPLGSRPGGVASVMPGENRWPAEVPGFRATVEACQRELDALGRVILRGVSESLGLPPEEIGASCDPPGGSCLWLLHYPAVPLVQGNPGQGTSPHTDLHPLAIIVQDDVGGLEVRAEGVWETLDPRRQRVVCQMGETIGRWSNDVFRPNVHRVRSPAQGSRYSLALFMQPAFEAIVAPVVTCTGSDRPSRYAPIAFGTYLSEWFRALDEGRAGYVPEV